VFQDRPVLTKKELETDAGLLGTCGSRRLKDMLQEAETVPISVGEVVQLGGVFLGQHVNDVTSVEELAMAQNGRVGIEQGTKVL
jgi:hypothetical protein